MASRQGAYETPASDTSFRKKYDRAEYAQKAQEREAKEKEEGRLRYEAKLQGKKYHAPATGNESLTTARSTRFDPTTNIGKIMLVPAGAATGKRGRGAGFYCEACDLTFKDNVQWVEHENSIGHLRKIGQTGEVQRATAEEVHERIRGLWERVQAEERQEKVSLGERLEVREKERVVKLEYGEDVRVEGEHDEDDMLALMGMKGFGSSKK